MEEAQPLLPLPARPGLPLLLLALGLLPLLALARCSAVPPTARLMRCSTFCSNFCSPAWARPRLLSWTRAPTPLRPSPACRTSTSTSRAGALACHAVCAMLRCAVLCCPFLTSMRHACARAAAAVLADAGCPGSVDACCIGLCCCLAPAPVGPNRFSDTQFCATPVSLQAVHALPRGHRLAVRHHDPDEEGRRAVRSGWGKGAARQQRQAARTLCPACPGRPPARLRCVPAYPPALPHVPLVPPANPLLKPCLLPGNLLLNPPRCLSLKGICACSPACSPYPTDPLLPPNQKISGWRRSTCCGR